jgi:hypothetical protein
LLNKKIKDGGHVVLRTPHLLRLHFIKLRRIHVLSVTSQTHPDFVVNYARFWLKNAAIVAKSSWLTILSWLWLWRRRHYCRKAPHNTSGFARGIDLVDTPVVSCIISHRAGIELCSELVLYKRRRIARAEVHIV